MVYTNLKKPKGQNAINFGLVEVIVLIINLESYNIVHCSSSVHNKGVLWKLFTTVADYPPLSLSSLYTEMSLSPSTDTGAPSLCQMQDTLIQCHMSV